MKISLVKLKLMFSKSYEAVTSNGGIPVISKPGMTIIAGRMEQEGALFAGEMSSHFYFRENANRDNGIIPLLLVLELMSKENKPLSALVNQFTSKYFISGEINFSVQNAPSLLKEIEQRYHNGTIEHIDGVSIAYPDWRFNVRASNTEPLVRLNVEAKTKELAQQKTAQLIDYIIKEFGGQKHDG